MFSKDEIFALNSKLWNLQAEIEIAKSSESKGLPQDKNFQFSWAEHSLKEEVKSLEDTLENLVITKEKCIQDKKQLLQDEKERYIILGHLHRKLARRLRRFSRDYYSSPYCADSNNKNVADENKRKKGEKSLYKILKGLIVELRGRSYTFEQDEKLESIHIDASLPQNLIELLSSITEPSEEDPELFSLKKPHLKGI